MSVESLPDGGGLLGHRYRRHLLYCLYLYATPIRLPDVANQLTVWDPDTDDEEFPRERFRIYDDLYYKHLPVLCEEALVEYSQREDVVDWGPDAEAFKPVVKRNLLTEVTDLLCAERNAFDADEESVWD